MSGLILRRNKKASWSDIWSHFKVTHNETLVTLLSRSTSRLQQANGQVPVWVLIFTVTIFSVPQSPDFMTNLRQFMLENYGAYGDEAFADSLTELNNDFE